MAAYWLLALTVTVLIVLIVIALFFDQGGF